MWESARAPSILPAISPCRDLDDGVQARMADTSASTPQHAARRAVLDEVHARPFQLIDPPRRVLHQSYVVSADQGRAALAALDAWCARTSAPRPDPDSKFHRAAFPGGGLRYEAHTEFVSFSWDTAVPAEGEPFAWPIANPPPMGGDLIVPGDLLVGIDLVMLPVATAPANFESLFDLPSLSVSSAYGGAAIIVTDFRQDARGNTRILVIDHGLGAARAGALAQRVIEIEAYRTFALLGLPEAYRVSPIIGEIERELVATTDRMQTERGLGKNADQLDALVKLAARLETEAARSSYRFAATRAYDAIVKSRLDAIDERSAGSYSTWRSFLDRRTGPAMRTCQSVADRQGELSAKLSRAANMLRTRVDVEMQTQNTKLLAAMNDRAKMQLRLQQTVEGLSVAAVSYYVLGLFLYVARGLKDAGLSPLEPSLAVAIATPLVVLGMWWTVRRLRRLHDERKDADQDRDR
jgi:uncharacterized membrane-anchored protein